MNHKRIWPAAVACLLAFLTVAQAKALMIAPPPIALRPAPADLIVTGTRATTGLRSLIQSSVADHVLRRGHRPVLIVPPGP